VTLSLCNSRAELNASTVLVKGHHYQVMALRSPHERHPVDDVEDDEDERKDDSGHLVHVADTVGERSLVRIPSTGIHAAAS